MRNCARTGTADLRGLRRSDLKEHDDVLSIEAAERSADRTQAVVDAL